jgi:hypothetical protein
MEKYTMVARHGVSEKQIVGYTLISSDYKTQYATPDSIVKAIKAGQIAVTNLEVEQGKLVSTNGALNNYTLIDVNTNEIVDGTARSVILNRVEQEGKLVGYTVFTDTGRLAEVNVADAVKLASNNKISNGKIRHTESGDIVSSIKGNYPLRNIEIAKAPKAEVIVDLMYFASVVDTSIEYCGAVISCASAAQMNQVTDTLIKSNSKILKDCTKACGEGVKNSLSAKRMGATSLFCVFEVALLNKLIKSGVVIENNIGSLIVSIVDFDEEGRADESTAVLNDSWAVTETNNGSDKTFKSLKAYTKKVIDQFKGVKLADGKSRNASKSL